MIERYTELGWDLKLIPAGEKGPRAAGWPEIKYNIADLKRHLSRGGNIGGRFGQASGGTVDVDHDCPEALALAETYLPSTNAVFGRASKPRSHYLYIACGAVFAAYTDPLTGETLVELRSDGRDGGAHQTLLPPSVADGERRVWCGEVIEPAVVDAATLTRRVAWLAIGCLTMRYLSEHAARRPGPDLPDILQEADPALGQAARQWLGKRDEPRGQPKPRHLMSNDELRLAEIVAAIPNSGLCWEDWNRVGLAVYSASGGSEEGFIAFDDLSARSAKYDPYRTKARWQHFHRSPPNRIGVGTLVFLARQNGWTRSAAA
jgi:hypothetical protein